MIRLLSVNSLPSPLEEAMIDRRTILKVEFHYFRLLRELSDVQLPRE